MTTEKKIKEKFKNVVKDLEDNSPEMLEEIKKKYPNYEYLLYSDGMPMDSIDKEDIGEYKTMLHSIKSSLMKNYSQVEILFFKLKKRLKTWNGVKFAGQIITTITGATLFILLIGEPAETNNNINNLDKTEQKKIEKKEGENIKKFFGPTLILVSSILALFATYKTTTTIGGEQLDKKILDLTDFLKETDGLIGDIERYNHPNPNYDTEVINQQLSKYFELRSKHIEIKLIYGGAKS